MAREVENEAYGAFLVRIIKAMGRRAAAGDVEHLRVLKSLRAHVSAAETVAVRGLREQGYSWEAIARGLGVSRQAAFQRWGHDDGADVDHPRPALW